MPRSVFLGNVNGTRFAAVHTLMPRERASAQFGLDCLTHAGVHKTPTGWLSAVIDPVLSQDLTPYLGGEVQEIGAVAPDVVAHYLGEATVENMFGVKAAMIAELTS
jgi:hypothetical protein